MTEPNRLRTWFEDNAGGLTIREVARRAGRASTTLDYWLGETLGGTTRWKGYTLPPDHILEALATGMGLPINVVRQAAINATRPFDEGDLTAAQREAATYMGDMPEDAQRMMADVVARIATWWASNQGKP